MGYLPGYIAIFFAALLAALLVALIFRRDFRDALLGGPGEATIFGLLTVKGVGIVLLCGLLIGGILFALTRPPAPVLPAQLTGGTNGPITMRIFVHFEPNDEVNPGNPKFQTLAFIKTPEGDQPIRVVSKLEEGSLSLTLTVPDMETPFYISFKTPNGMWKTDDYSVKEARAVARKE